MVTCDIFKQLRTQYLLYFAINDKQLGLHTVQLPQMPIGDADKKRIDF